MSLHITACQPCPDDPSLGHESSLIFAGGGQEVWILVPALPLAFHVTVASVASPSLCHRGSWDAPWSTIHL